MGLVGVILDFITGTEVKVDFGGGDVRTLDFYGPPGDDSQPMIGDFVVMVETPGDAGGSVVAYSDDVNAGVAGVGEKRIYARAADGTAICDILLKSDGSITATNEMGTFALLANGVVDINNGNFTVDP